MSKGIYSPQAGVACQTCDIPPCCTLEATIKFGKQEGIYRQESVFRRNFFQLIDLSEKKKREAVPLELSAKSKNCVSKNPHCPIGHVFDENNNVVATFTPNKPYKGELRYTKKTEGFAINENNPFTALAFLLDRDSFIDDERYRQVYRLSGSECDNQPLTPLPSSSLAPIVSPLHASGKRTLFSAYFFLVLQRSVEVSLKISYSSSVDILTDEERKKQRTEQNIARGYRPSHGGWTRYTGKFEAKKGIQFEGEITTQLGQEKKTWTAELGTEYKKQTNNIKTLNSINVGLAKLNNALSHSGRDPYPILQTEFVYPILNITGKGEAHQTERQDLITQGHFVVKLEPLFGFNIKLDLLTAFAMYYRLDTVVSKAREKMAAHADDVKSGKKGAYAEAKLDLTFSCGIDAKFGFKTDDDGEWNIDKENKGIELNGEIIGDTNIEAGVNYWGISGFFKAGADIRAKMKIGFDDNQLDANKLDVVVYHEGITATAYMDYSIGTSKDKKNESRDAIAKSDIKRRKFGKKQKKEEWIIYDELPKDKSTWRWTLD